MTSMVAMLLNGDAKPVLKPGRVIRFGLPEERILIDGPVRDRVVRCLELSSVPMQVSAIAEVVRESDMRVKRALRKLMHECMVEEIALKGGLLMQYRII